MRTIERTSQFKRDYERESRGRHRTYLDASLVLIVEVLANDQSLEPRHHDHALSGEWKGHRDCHVRPDLVLIYQKSGADSLGAASVSVNTRRAYEGALRRLRDWLAGRPLDDATLAEYLAARPRGL